MRVANVQSHQAREDNRASKKEIVHALQTRAISPDNILKGAFLHRAQSVPLTQTAALQPS